LTALTVMFTVAAQPQRPAVAIGAATGAAGALAARLPAGASGGGIARGTVAAVRARIAAAASWEVVAPTTRSRSGASSSAGHDQPRAQASVLVPGYGSHVGGATAAPTGDGRPAAVEPATTARGGAPDLHVEGLTWRDRQVPAHPSPATGRATIAPTTFSHGAGRAGCHDVDAAHTGGHPHVVVPSVAEQLELDTAWAGFEVKASSTPHSSSAPRTVDTLSRRITISRVLISLALLSSSYTPTSSRAGSVTRRLPSPSEPIGLAGDPCRHSP
jgi:hypothetical protein